MIIVKQIQELKWISNLKFKNKMLPRGFNSSKIDQNSSNISRKMITSMKKQSNPAVPAVIMIKRMIKKDFCRNVWTYSYC